MPLLTGVGHLQICGVCLVADGLPALEGAQLGGDGPSVNSMCLLPVPPAPSLTVWHHPTRTPQLRSAGPLPSSFFHWDPVHRTLWLGCPTSPGHTPMARWPATPLWVRATPGERAGGQAVSGHELQGSRHVLESSLLISSGSGAQEFSAFGLKAGKRTCPPSPHSSPSLIPRDNVVLQPLDGQVAER